MARVGWSEVVEEQWAANSAAGAVQAGAVEVRAAATRAESNGGLATVASAAVLAIP